MCGETAKAIDFDSEEITITVESLEDLRLLVYVLNSGVLRIRECSHTKTLDFYDRRAVRYGQDLFELLCQEYRACGGKNAGKDTEDLQAGAETEAETEA